MIRPRYESHPLYRRARGSTLAGLPVSVLARLSRRTRRAIRMFGERACTIAFALHCEGHDARTIALEGPPAVRTAPRAEAAVAAGRELHELALQRSR